MLPMALPPPPALVLMAEQGASLETRLADRAKADGWSQSQAGWIGKLGVAAAESGAGEGGFEAAYRAGRRALSIAYFDHALAEGKSRLVAFLTVVDLEKQVAQRAGVAAAEPADADLQRAYAAVEVASSQGASSAAQLEAGFAILRSRQQ
ncbi:hypothetical protein [Bosea sp. (in: a-proteobacteria)]|uniref:hypothetical protein n=1 Tax=Bosea sp. (in: a-proteobacteria) TaxID=1871050 RepID=UPI002628CE5C|nr:hypothetical protein [Bosea sp. (in: a-proteobacteria)]MCO5089500.1 hypothetical protein [Bosea sp. (in: a-proteobacteria)]